jgi:murein DD-endopeptidase MepM/ murein hydrolase activator NlpD
MRSTFFAQRIIYVIATVFFCFHQFEVLAQEVEAEAAVEALNAVSEEISEKKAHIDQINRKIDQYQEAIEAKQAESATLRGEMELLGNRVAKSELEIEATREQMAATDQELAIVEQQIVRVQADQSRQRDIMKRIILELHISDEQTLIEMLFAHETFSDMFDQLAYLEMVHTDLQGALEDAKRVEASLIALRAKEEAARASQVALEGELKKIVARLREEQAAQEVLLAATKSSEAQFSALLYELREEQQFITQQIAALQADLEKRLYEQDALGDGSVLTWPVTPRRGVSATFHDPTYPYRHLFEHSGLDIPVDVGTPVLSAAPGYVAWTREGRLYGYYVMVIHTDGIATLYAHLSKILVESEQFVTRGQAVGLSGGRPGLPGAGLSTGPHLHFEVRLNGIPTDPLGYLVKTDF